MDKKEKSYKIGNIQIKDYVTENLRKKICDFAAIFDRFSEMTQIVHFKNPSYRQRNKKQ